MQKYMMVASLLLHVSGRPAPEALLQAMKRGGGKAVWSQRRVRFEHGDGLTPDLLPAAKAELILKMFNVEVHGPFMVHQSFLTALNTP